tara:strand:+ start:4756 stop:6351 length:1596 start_codon:yes stop_codon:yes gene_type:complete
MRAKLATQKKLSAKKIQADKLTKQAKKARAASKRAQEASKKVDDALKGRGKSVVTTDDLKHVPKTLRDHLKDHDVVFRPNEGPQTTFLESPERDILYGGAAGGGKSYALLADVLRDASNPNHRGLLLRRTLAELTELIDKSRQVYTKAFPGAVFKQAKSTWEFPSGAKIWFSYVDDDRDVTRYQGQAFNWIGIDEITQYPTPYTWNYLRSRLRTTDPALGMYMRCTANPGGVGGWWVKKMYLDHAPPGDPFWARDFDNGEILKYPPRHTKAGEPLFLRKFVPARLTDNPYLFDDGQYEAMLMSLPEVERKRLLDGDWDVAEGAAFTEFSKSMHVSEPFDIPEGWARVRSGDYGYSSPSCILWGAIDWDNNLWVYRELYVKGFTGERLGDTIAMIEKDDPPMQLAVLDASCWNRTGLGPSIAETMIKRGVRWIPSDRNRMAGKIEVHRRLACDDYGNPRVRVFSTCNNLIRTLPTLPLSKTNPEDVDTKADDHAYDALRYMVMSRTLVNAHNTHRMTRHTQKYEPQDQVFGY